MEALPELKGQGFDLLLDEVYTTGKPYAGNEVPISLSRDVGLAPELRYFNFSYQPMFDENKAIYSILVFGYEVTEQVIAKMQNKEDNLQREKALEQQVQERTIQLRTANELLVTKNEQLLKINKELQAFTFVSSHDLQEPLRKIKTFTKLIVEREDQTLSERGRDYFNRIQGSAERMQTLIGDLLVYSQASSTEGKLETTNLDDILRDVKDDLAELITAKDAVIEAKPLCEATIIRYQFRQLFNNLIANALKFSVATKSPHILISSKRATGGELNKDIGLFSAERLVADKQYCHISFSDNGIGFEAEYNDKIFELFQRLHTKDEYPGTGVGLAIVKKIVENHEGLIIPTSELGKGSTFDIFIPA
jgi:two-component system, chemotaxis family, CheB/CheR fusion protein